MKLTVKLMPALAAALITYGSLVREADAALGINFTISGADTVVSYSGSLNFAGLSFLTTPVGPTPGVSLFATGSSDIGLRWNTGIGTVRSYASPWSSSPDFTKGNTQINTGTPTFTQQFSLFDTVVLLDVNDFAGDVWTGSGSTTFPNVAASDLVNSSSPVVWTLNNGAADTVTFQVIPEPSSGLLLILGALGLAAIRRRRIIQVDKTLVIKRLPL